MACQTIVQYVGMRDGSVRIDRTNDNVVEVRVKGELDNVGNDIVFIVRASGRLTVEMDDWTSNMPQHTETCDER